MEVKSKLLDVFLIRFTSMKMPAIWSKEGCLVRRKKVLLVVFLVVVLWTRRGAWCLVFGKEDRRFWRGSLVSGERRRLVKRRSCWFCFKRMEPVLGAEKKTERKGVSVVPDACSTSREGVYT